MKRIMKISLLALSMVLLGSLRNNVSAQYDYNSGGSQYDNNYGGQNEVTYQTFYDQLSPYGQWVDYPGYGYVWVPEVSEDFRPYSTNGHWVWTDDYEWMWVSDYDWGWGPFHYGRWEEDPDYGWFWVPGYEWSPAWVAWRDGGDYYGWAPLRPGISINLNFNIGSYNPPNDYWCFVPRQYITSPRIYDYYVDRSININIISRTTIININRYSSNYGWRSGPSRYEAERYCGRIEPVRFRQSYTPGRYSYRNNEVSFYRPNVRRDEGRANVAPRQFERYDRNNGGFRNRTTDNNGGRNNDFRRNNDNTNGNVYNGNGRRDRTGNDQPFRTNDGNRQPQVDNNGGRRPFERTDNTGGDRRNNDMNNGGFPRRDVVTPDRQEKPRQFERRDADVNRGNDQIYRRNDNGGQRPVETRPVQQEQPRQFERRNVDMNRGNDQIYRRNDNAGQRPVETRPVQQEQPRQFERSNVDMNRGNDQIYRRNDNGGQRPVETRPVQQEQPRQFERRNNDNGNGGRQQPVVQQRQEQPRSFERTDNGGNRGNGNKGNDDGGRGKGRRF